MGCETYQNRRPLNKIDVNEKKKTFSRLMGLIGIGERISGNGMTSANWRVLGRKFYWERSVYYEQFHFRLPPTPISLSHPAPLENQVVAWSQSIWISVSFHGSSILIVHSVQKSPIGNIPNEITLNGVFANVSVYDSLLSRNKKILD